MSDEELFEFMKALWNALLDAGYPLIQTGSCGWAQMSFDFQAERDSIIKHGVYEALRDDWTCEEYILFGNRNVVRQYSVSVGKYGIMEGIPGVRDESGDIKVIQKLTKEFIGRVIMPLKLKYLS